MGLQPTRRLLLTLRLHLTPKHKVTGNLRDTKLKRTLTTNLNLQPTMNSIARIKRKVTTNLKVTTNPKATNNHRATVKPKVITQLKGMTGQEKRILTILKL